MLLIAAEFTTLFEVHAATRTAPIKSVIAGPHDAFALVPIALASLGLAFIAFRDRSRPALVAIGALAIVTLLIALARDLPDAHSSGIVGSSATHYLNATTVPGLGLFLETAGAMTLLLTACYGLLLHPDTRVRALGSGGRERPEQRAAQPPRSDSGGRGPRPGK